MPTHSGALELVRQLEATRLDSVGGEAKETAICEFDDIDLKIVEFEDLKRRGDFRGVLYKVHELLEEGGRIRGDQDVALRLLMAEAVLLQGEVERGSGLIADLFSKFGDNDRVVCSYAAVLCMRGQWDEAHNLFMRALRINPRSDIALAGIGGFLQEKGDLTGAWQRYSEALSINVECKRALLGFIQIGHLERKFKDLEKALRDYLELHPADVDFLYALAGCLYADGRYEEARDPLFRIRIFDPQNSRMTELLNIVEDRISMAPVVASPG
jgi:tetratricopeptide (TPR) repeat protein